MDIPEAIIRTDTECRGNHDTMDSHDTTHKLLDAVGNEENIGERASHTLQELICDSQQEEITDVVTVNEREEEGPAELIATADTEELFKKYLMERPRDQKEHESLLQLSYDSLLRYLSCPEILHHLHTLALSNNGIISQVDFLAIFSELLSLHFPKVVLTDAHILSLSRLFKKFCGEEGQEGVIRLEELIGGLSILCKGKQEDNMLATLNYMAQHNTHITLYQLKVYIKSLFTIAIDSVPNSAKAAHLSINELTDMIVHQFAHDVLCEGLVDPACFVYWVLGNTRIQQHRETLQPAVLNDSLESTHKSILGKHPTIPFPSHYGHSYQWPQSYVYPQDMTYGEYDRQYTMPQLVSSHIPKSFRCSPSDMNSRTNHHNIDHSMTHTIDSPLPPAFPSPYSHPSIRGLGDKQPRERHQKGHGCQTARGAGQLGSMLTPYATFSDPQLQFQPSTASAYRNYWY